jgi:large conductance mechanosensitive channel
MIKNFLNEFKAFAMRGNVVDLAVGVVIGTAFGKIVSSLVDTVIMPLIGGISGGVDLKGLKYSFVSQFVDKTVDLNYGLFLQSILDFLIVAFAIFVAIKAMNTLKKKEELAPVPTVSPEPSEEVQLLTQIRDLLKK